MTWHRHCHEMFDSSFFNAPPPPAGEPSISRRNLPAVRSLPAAPAPPQAARTLPRPRTTPAAAPNAWRTVLCCWSAAGIAFPEHAPPPCTGDRQHLLTHVVLVLSLVLKIVLVVLVGLALVGLSNLFIFLLLRHFIGITSTSTQVARARWLPSELSVHTINVWMLRSLLKPVIGDPCGVERVWVRSQPEHSPRGSSAVCAAVPCACL